MKRFADNDEFDDLEARLRDERPGPSDELVRRLPRAAPRGGAGWFPTRVSA